jgi:hypothetical protein
MKTFRELLEAKITQDLIKTVPHAPGEKKFYDKHIQFDILKNFRQQGNDELFNGTIVKTFPRKENHFGNDEDQSITAYESEELKENWKYLQYDTDTEAKNAREEHFSKKGGACRMLPGNKLKYAGDFLGTKPKRKKMTADGSHIVDKDRSYTDFVNKHNMRESNINESEKKRHIFIDGKWAATSTWDKNNKEAYKNFKKTHPSLNKVKIEKG